MTGLERRVEKLTAILEVAKALAAERDLDQLLELVVKAATHVVDAERSTLYLYDRDRHELWSKVAEGSAEIRFPASTGIAGAALLSGQIVNIPDAHHDPRFNPTFDAKTGFRTRSVLAVPMSDQNGDRVGVVQALNKHGEERFTTEDEELLFALGGVAAAAVTNVHLHEEISRLFEGFAQAAVLAVESRDPATAGHSSRVAALTVRLAETTCESGVGRWQGCRFTKDQMRELRYAALLHDFGKVGVREEVLVKAQKLYPGGIERLEERFEAIRLSLQARSLGRQLARPLPPEPERSRLLAEERERLQEELSELDGTIEFVRALNAPGARNDEERLAAIGQRTFEDSRGRTRAFLTEPELRLLSIPRGTLADEERIEMESHVTHTFRFLSQIPWTRSLEGVPAIAYGHHEKLTGRGYPRGLSTGEIPVQTRMITICDIYDALTASDRPYKPSLPHATAMALLREEAAQGAIDRDLLQVFVDQDVPALVKAA